MIELRNGTRLITHADELPEISEIDRLFGDFETSSGDPAVKALNVWHQVKASVGFAFTVDDHPGAWYVPLGHHDARFNVDPRSFAYWLRRIFSETKRWVNHNIKYDCHVSRNIHNVCPNELGVELYDTLTMAKMLDSSRRQYGLDHLSRDWLRHDIIGYYDALLPYLHSSHDYAEVPPDVMGEYAGQDVITNRSLYRYIRDRMPEDCRDVETVEIGMTTVLREIESDGIRIVDKGRLLQEEFLVLHHMLTAEAELRAIVGREFRPHVSDDLYDVLCNQYGLPVIKYTPSGNPAFDRTTLKEYLAHPLTPIDVIKKIMLYKSNDTYRNFFLKPYQVLADENDIIHPTYNQTVRSGRLSCKDPNMMQLSPRARRLIIPPEGESIISVDYSQIEYRLICHYIQDPKALAAYRDNPDADFHTLVSEWCGVHRKPAKYINFLMGYGGGKEKLVWELMKAEELVADLRIVAENQVDAWLGERGIVDQGKRDDMVVQRFNALAKARAEEVYDKYHSMLPGLKRTSYKASQACKEKGYVFNLAGRRRHLPLDRAHIAFNAIMQSLAADIMKERMVYLASILRRIPGRPIKMRGQVHDEVIFTAPTEIARDPQVALDIIGIMEHPAILPRLRLPLRCSIGFSEKHWYEAAKGAKTTRAYDVADCHELQHLM